MKLTKEALSVLTSLQVNIFIVPQWPIDFRMVFQEVIDMLYIMIMTCKSMGFHFNLCQVVSFSWQQMVWLGMEWNTKTGILQLSLVNQRKIQWKLFQACMSATLTLSLGESPWLSKFCCRGASTGMSTSLSYGIGGDKLFPTSPLPSSPIDTRQSMAETYFLLHQCHRL